MFKNKEMDIVHGPLLKNMLLFAIPLMLSNLLQIALNAADTIVVGKFAGQEALAAVGATGPVAHLLINLFNGVAIGANIVIATQIGKGKQEEIHRSVHTTYFLALTGGLILSVVGQFASRWALGLMGTPENIIAGSTLYMRIYFLGAIPLLVYNFGAAVLRSKGDTTHPMLFLLASGVINIVLNLFFVIGLHQGVRGVAVATVISETVSAVLVTQCLMKQTDATRLEWNKIAPDPILLKEILRIGVPAGLQGMMWSISNIAVQASINSFGSVAIAGNSAAANIEGFVYIGMGGFSQACITFTSQATGAREVERVRKVLRWSTLMIILSSYPICWLLDHYGEIFLALYTDDPAVIAMGMERMRIVVYWLWLNGVLDAPASSMRGMGFSTTPTCAMLAGIVGVRLLYIFLYWPSCPTLDSLYFCFPLSWTITIIINFLLWTKLYHTRMDA